jgi:hypothetical protein
MLSKHPLRRNNARLVLISVWVSLLHSDRLLAGTAVTDLEQNNLQSMLAARAKLIVDCAEMDTRKKSGTLTLVPCTFVCFLA